MKLLAATRNSGKLREIRRILGTVPGIDLLDLDEAGIACLPEEEDLEPHDTFEANARSKAVYYATRSGLATVADDSGIEVDALGGAPGVRTKRFAFDEGAAPLDLDGQELDDANNAHLVARLASVDAASRGARYVCVAVFVRTGADDALVSRGEAAGVVVDAPRGVGGFGYDPHILDSSLGKTFAEMTPDEKDARSHRGHAFRGLADLLQARFPGGASAATSEGR